MKLFGGSAGNHAHAQVNRSGQPQKSPVPAQEEPTLAFRPLTQKDIEESKKAGADKKVSKADGNGGNPKPPEKSGRRRRTPLIAGGAVLVLIVGVIIFMQLWVTAPAVDDSGLAAAATPSPSPLGQALGSQNVSPSPTPDGQPAAQRKAGTYTFLVAGMDDGNGNTDTIMVGKLDTVEGTINVVSIPRDTLVNVSWSLKKVNTYYAFADGVDGLKSGIRDLLGFNIDSYAVVNLRAIEDLVDCIGGVYYDVPINMYYDDPYQNLHIAIPKGYQWLNGENALKVMRFRMGNNNSGYVDGDMGRIGTQQDFLMSVAKQMLQLKNIPNINDAAKIFAERVETNLSAGEIVWYAKEFLKLDSENIQFHTLPGNTNDYAYGMQCVTIDIEQWLDMINEYINPWDVEITQDNINVIGRDSQGVLTNTAG